MLVLQFFRQPADITASLMRRPPARADLCPDRHLGEVELVWGIALKREQPSFGRGMLSPDPIGRKNKAQDACSVRGRVSCSSADAIL